MLIYHLHFFSPHNQLDLIYRNDKIKLKTKIEKLVWFYNLGETIFSSFYTLKLYHNAKFPDKLLYSNGAHVLFPIMASNN